MCQINDPNRMPMVQCMTIYPCTKGYHLLCIPVCPQNHRDLHVSDSRLLGIKAWIIIILIVIMLVLMKGASVIR